MPHLKPILKCKCEINVCQVSYDPQLFADYVKEAISNLSDSTRVQKKIVEFQIYWFPLLEWWNVVKVDDTLCSNKQKLGEKLSCLPCGQKSNLIDLISETSYMSMSSFMPGARESWRAIDPRCTNYVIGQEIGDDSSSTLHWILRVWGTKEIWMDGWKIYMVFYIALIG